MKRHHQLIPDRQTIKPHRGGAEVKRARQRGHVTQGKARQGKAMQDKARQGKAKAKGKGESRSSEKVGWQPVK